MTWFPGVRDPYYVRYAVVAGCALAATGAVLVPLRLWRRTAERARGAYLAWRSWIVLAPAILLVLGLGREVFILGMAALSLLFVREFARATGLDQDRTVVLVVCVGVLGYYAMALLKLYGIFMAMPVHTIAVVYIIPSYRNQHEGMLGKLTLATVALIYLGWFPAHLAYLANYREL